MFKKLRKNDEGTEKVHPQNKDQTEGKAKVVAADWEHMHLNAALATQRQG